MTRTALKKVFSEAPYYVHHLKQKNSDNFKFIHRVRRRKGRSVQKREKEKKLANMCASQMMVVKRESTFFYLLGCIFLLSEIALGCV